MKRGFAIFIYVLAIAAIIFLVLYLIQKDKRSKISTQQVEVRRDACNSCEYQETREGVKVCSLCGCITDLKTEWPDQECPDNPPKWTVVNT